ncbi:MptD family putative ECF transporter S component [Lacrimispora sp.]|uniref:MptD family putative ECF transporter S component n=1 Tax=Lacrimispora sp. TaxID=2719234 RepID=UPI0028A5CB98|nr:MptD family putative ECF transporter S component [Lacrimispora sp.]
MEKTNKLTGKDLINVGIYSAMTLAVFFTIGLLTVLPVLYPLLLFLFPFFCGIPMMLYYTKIEKFGMLTITGILMGIFFFLIGYTWIGFAFWAAGGFAADLMLIPGHYQSFKFTLLSYVFFSLGMIGCPAPMWFAGQAYWDNINDSMGEQYASSLNSMMPPWMFWAGMGILLVGSICGSLLGRKMLKKHFQRAGIV